MKTLAEVERQFIQRNLEARWLHAHIPLRWISGTPYTGEVKLVRAQQQDAYVESENGVGRLLPISELERLEALGHQEPRPSWSQRLAHSVRQWWRARH